MMDDARSGSTPETPLDGPRAEQEGPDDGNECPRCHHLNHNEPDGFTHEGAARIYCDGCGRFYLDFDFGGDER